MTTPDHAFLRRAVEASDLAALRATLYQMTQDPELATLGPVVTLAPEDHEKLVARCLHLLETRLEGYTPRVPSHQEIRDIMDLVLGEPTRDEHFEVRRNRKPVDPLLFLP